MSSIKTLSEALVIASYLKRVELDTSCVSTISVAFKIATVKAKASMQIAKKEAPKETFKARRFGGKS